MGTFLFGASGWDGAVEGPHWAPVRFTMTARARERLAAIARRRGLTPEELADRILEAATERMGRDERYARRIAEVVRRRGFVEPGGLAGWIIERYVRRHDRGHPGEAT